MANQTNSFINNHNQLAERYTTLALSASGAQNTSSADTLDYLHRITTASFKRFKVGDHTQGFFLNPQGKIQLGFYAYYVNPSTVLLACLTHNADEALRIVEAMHFREAFTVEPKPELTFSRSTQANNTGEPRWSYGRKNDTQLLELGFSKSTLSDPATLFWWDYARNHPFTAAEFSNSMIPLELVSPEFLSEWVQENKGCYPGQEVVERIRSMGQPPKFTVRIYGNQKGDDLESLENRIAESLSKPETSTWGRYYRFTELTDAAKSSEFAALGLSQDTTWCAFINLKRSDYTKSLETKTITLFDTFAATILD